MIFSKSIDESKEYALNLYRASIERSDEISKLKDNLNSSDVDICRLKIRADEQTAFSMLDSLNIPYQLYNINYANIVKLDKLDPESLEWDEKSYRYVLCPANKRELLYEMVSDTISKKTWLNYPSRIASHILTQDKEVKATAQYACSFLDETNDCKVWLLMHKEKEIGFFMGHPYQDGFMGTLYGITPQFRNEGHSKIIYKMMLSICKKMNFKFFRNEIGIMNFPSQRSAQSQNMIPMEISFHFELFPFHSTKGIAITETNLAKLESLKNHIFEFFKQFVEGKELVAIKSNRFVREEPVHSEIVLITNNPNFVFFAIRQFGQEKNIPCEIHYLQYSG